MEKNEFAKYFIDNRNRLNISRSAIADNFNVSLQTISKWESGQSFPDLSLASDIANLFKTDIDDLFSLVINDKEVINNNPFNIDEFAKYFKYLRTFNNLTLQDIAKEFNISYQTISKWENGQSVPSFGLFPLIAKYFNKKPSELYYGKSELITHDTDKINKEELKDEKTSEKKKQKSPILYIGIGVLIALAFSIPTSIVLIKNQQKLNNGNISNDVTINLSNEVSGDDSSSVEDSTTKINVNQYNINYVIPDGAINDNDLSYNEGEIIQFKEPTLTGYSFIGWYKEETFDNIIYSTDDINEDITLYARFKANTYTITFDPGDGNCITSAKQIIYGSNLELPTATYEDHTFTGWIDANGNPFLNGDIYKIADNITLYAKYDNSYAVKFDIDYVDNIDPLYLNDTLVTYLPTPSVDGASFDGWYYNDELINVPFDIDNYTNNTSITLKGKWTILSNNEDFSYINNTDNTISITKYKKNNKTLIIPETIDDKTVTKIEREAFKNNTDIEKLYIPNTVTLIKESAFENSNIKELYLQDSVIEIEDNILKDTNIEILQTNILDKPLLSFFGASFLPDSLNKIIALNPLATSATNFFKNITTTIKMVELSPNFTSIPESYFNSCYCLYEVKLPDTLTTLNERCFYNCTNLTKINFPDKLTIIPKYAFSKTNLEFVRLPDNIKTIDDNAFANDVELKFFYPGKSVEYIGENAIQSYVIFLPKSLKHMSSNEYVYSYILYEGSDVQWGYIDIDSYSINGNGDTLFNVTIDNTINLIENDWCIYATDNSNNVIFFRTKEGANEQLYEDFISKYNILYYIGWNIFEGTFNTLKISEKCIYIANKATIASTIIFTQTTPPIIKNEAFMFGQNIYIPVGTFDDYASTEYGKGHKDLLIMY